jgi:YVTN family beta-propeller protein
MKTTIIKSAIAAIALTVMVTACKKDSSPATQTTTKPPTGAYGAGVFVINQGQFGHGNADVSFFNRSTKAVSNGIFQSVNNRPLGDVAQSMTIYNGKGYIVVNNSAKVEVVNDTTFKSVATISGFTYPYALIVLNSTTAYVSDWGSSGNGFIGVVNLSNNTLASKINTGHSPGAMVISGNYLYAANAGGLGTDSTITVINTQTNTVTATIQVNYSPNSLNLDVNGKIWVTCGGYDGWPNTSLYTPGSLVCINPSTNAIVNTIVFPGSAYHPSNTVIDGTLQNLYYLCNSQVFAFPVTASALSSTAIINRSFYGLGYDNSAKLLYTANAGDFTNPGWFLRYQTTGVVVDSFKVGVIPGYFCFN